MGSSSSSSSAKPESVTPQPRVKKVFHLRDRRPSDPSTFDLSKCDLSKFQDLRHVEEVQRALMEYDGTDPPTLIAESLSIYDISISASLLTKAFEVRINRAKNYYEIAQVERPEVLSLIMKSVSPQVILELRRLECIPGGSPNIDPLQLSILNDDLDMFKSIFSQPKFSHSQEIGSMTYDEQNIKLDVLSFACFRSAVNIFKFLIQNGCPPTPTAVKAAIAGGEMEIIGILDEKGCSFEGTLDIASNFHQNQIFEWLVDNKVGKVETGKLLHDTIRLNNLSELFRLIENGVDPDKHGVYEKTPLHIAAYYENVLAMNILFELGVCPNRRDRDDNTPLLLAFRRGNLIGANYLLDHGANPNDTNAIGNNILHMAVESQNLECVELILTKKLCDVNSTNTGNMTGLHYAYESGDSEMVNLLKKHGAREDIVDYRNMTPPQRKTPT